MAYGMRPTRHDPDLRKRAAEYYRAGVSYKEIIRRFGFSNYVLTEILEEFGVPRRGKGKPRDQGATTPSD